VGETRGGHDREQHEQPRQSEKVHEVPTSIGRVSLPGGATAAMSAV